jgi:hypothetical protein
MVSQERIKRAETEAELLEAKMEKEALKSALRVVEGENGRMRRGSLIYPIMKEETVEEVGGLKDEEEDECRAVDLDEMRASRRVMDEAGREEGENMTARDLEADPGPSVSRSSSRIGLKSPVHSRQPSESMSMSGDVPPTVSGPISTLPRVPLSSSASLPAESEPQQQQQLHSIDVRPLVLPTSASISVSLQNQKSSSSSSLSLDEYETPISRSQSQSQSLSQAISPLDVHHSSDASHTQPTSAPIPEHEEDVHEREHHEPHRNEHEQKHTAWNTDDATTTTALQNEVPTSNATPAFSYTSPPNPDFKPSSPRNYLVDEPSPWA